MSFFESNQSENVIWDASREIYTSETSGIAAVSEESEAGKQSETAWESAQRNGSPTKGLSVLGAAAFVLGELAGGGVLAIPSAIVSTGWIGIALLVVFGLNAGYGGCRLGTCWQIIEERYPEYKSTSRKPYSAIAYRATGRLGGILLSICVQITLFGAGVVYVLLISQLLQELLSKFFPDVTYCTWALITALVLLFPTWLESPKDFEFAGLGAAVTSILAIILIITQIAITALTTKINAEHENHSISAFFLSFGPLMFSYGGASTFPTIQNDMKDRSKFPKSVVIGYIGLLTLYISVGALGYYVYGESVQPNIILSLQKNWVTIIINVLMSIHLLVAFLIIISPVSLELEETFRLPHTFCWQRIVLRTLLIVAILFVAETIPHFGKILSLIGGSTITMMTFIFPCYFYIKLCDQKSPTWPNREIPLHERTYLWMLIVIALIGGCTVTYNALGAMVGDSFVKPCYILNR